MSEPEVQWYIERIQSMLSEINKLVLIEKDLTNSMREIIAHNTNEIEIDLFTIIRKLKGWWLCTQGAGYCNHKMCKPHD